MTNHHNEETSENDLLKELETLKAEHNALLESARSILLHQDFTSSAKEIFSYCKKVTGATSGYVALLNKDGSENEVLFLDSGGRPCTVDQNLPMPIRGLRETAYRSLNGVYDNQFASSNWTKFLPEGHMQLDNVLFAPLIIENKVVGLIGLANKEGGFTERDLKFATALGDVAAVALRNSRNLELLKESEEKYREILETIEEGYYEVDLAGNFVFFNDSLCKMLGYESNEIKNLNYKEIHKNPDEVYKVYNRVYRTGEPEKSAGWSVITKDGREIFIEISVTLRRDDENKPIGFRGVTRDITERKHREEKLEYLSLHDQLTGLYNRTFFIEELNRLTFSRAYPISIISADVDELKKVNDTLGHAAGDQLIQACGNVLSNSLRKSDILARIGGDEFAVILPHTDEPTAKKIAERIRFNVAAYNEKQPVFSLSLSLGWATATNKGVGLEEIYKKADKLMLSEKISRRKETTE